MSVKKIIGTFLRDHNEHLYYSISEFLDCMRYAKRRHVPQNKIPAALEHDFTKFTGQPLDIYHPESYSQKIQWLKLFDDNPLRSDLTDKVKVRDWIKEKIGGEYLIPIYGVYDDPDEIDYNVLPDQFVIKMNHSSGWNIVVKDKSKLDKKKIAKTLKKWMKRDYAFWTEYEIHYSPIVPKIIIEKFTEDSKGELNDYKFLCFNGTVKYVWVDYDRFSNHKRNVYDLDWNLQPWNQQHYGNYLGETHKPENFDDMCRIADILCKGFRHVRVDLYNVDGKIYFGEMTFTNGSGFEGIFPVEYDYMLGNMIPLD